MGYPKEQNRLRENETIKNEKTMESVYLFYYVKKLLEGSSVIKVINFVLE